MSRAHYVAEAIARTIDLRKVIAINTEVQKLYGYTEFVPNGPALRKFLQANWKFKAASLDEQVDAYNLAYDIVESRVIAAQA